MTAPAINITRKGRWAVVAPSGIVSQHNTSIEASEAAANWSLSNAAPCRIEPPYYMVDVDNVVLPPVVEPPVGPVDPPEPEPPVIEPEPEPTASEWTDTRPDHYVIDIGPGEHQLNIPPDRRRSDSWVVVRGPRTAIITKLNDIASPSLIRFEGVTLKTRPSGRPGGEFAYVDCRLEMYDSIAHLTSKNWVIGCDIHMTGPGGVFPDGEIYALNNVLEHFQEDLIRSRSGLIDGLIIEGYDRYKDSHADMFEFAINRGTQDLTVRNITGPDGSYAICPGLRGITGGKCTNVVLENILVDLSINGEDHPGGAVVANGDWIDCKAKNVDIRGSSTRALSNFVARNFVVQNCPQLERLPGVEIKQ